MTPRKIATACMVGLCSVGARAEGVLDLSRVLRSYVDAANGLSDSLYRADSSGAMDPQADRPIIQGYYSKVRRDYVADPLVRQSATIGNLLTHYRESVDDVLDAISKNVKARQADLEKKKDTDAVRALAIDFSAFKRCVENDKGYVALEKAPLAVSTQFNSVARQLQQPMMSGRSGQRVELNPSAEMELSEVGQGLQGQNYDRLLQDCCSDYSSLECSKVVDANVRNIREAKRALLSVDLKRAPTPPDPLVEPGIKPAELGKFLQNSSFNSRLAQARHASDEADDTRADSEIQVFQQADAQCRQGAVMAQKESNPISKTLLNSLGKALKCHVLPAMTTLNSDLPIQRLTVGLAGADLKAGGWDFNCDPEETAFYFNARTNDPNKLAEEWGIPQLQNPPYIQSLRMLPPILSPFPMAMLPGNGGLVTPYGILGPGLGGASYSGSVLGVRGLASTAPATSGGNSLRIAPSRQNSFSRGLVQGQSLTLAVRQVATRISQGEDASQNAQILRSSSSRSLAFSQTLVRNTRRLGGAGRRQLASVSAARGRTVVRGLASVAASRTTSDQILESLRGRTLPTVTPTTPLGSLDDAEKQFQAEQARIQGLLQSYYGNIQAAQKRGQAVNTQIQEIILQRDAAIAHALEKMVDKAPKKQAKLMEELRRNLLALDRQLIQLKAEYDVYANSVADQASLVRQLTLFGNRSPNLPGIAGLPLPGVTGARQTTTFPTVNTKVPTSSRLFWDELPWKLFVPEAFAAMHGRFGAFSSRDQWWEGWKRFQNDVGAYAQSRHKEEKALRREALAAYRQRADSITAENALDEDTETLITLDLLASTLDEESQSLLNDAGRSKGNLSSGVVSDLKRVREDATELRASLDELARSYKDSYPRSADDNPEVWWGMLPEMLIH